MNSTNGKAVSFAVHCNFQPYSVVFTQYPHLPFHHNPPTPTSTATGPLSSDLHPGGPFWATNVDPSVDQLLETSKPQSH